MPDILHAARAPALRGRASFSQERMTYHREIGQVQYQSKDEKETRVFDRLDLWEIKRKPLPIAHAPPIDVFPTYDEQQGPRTDDHITDPDYPAEAYF